MLYAVICLLCALLCVYCACDCLKPSKFPPGPTWFPLVGCFLTFQRLKSKWGYTYMAIQELERDHGPILGLKLGLQKVVVISTLDLVRKALLQDEFNGRPDGFFFRVRAFGKRKGVLFTEGTTWSHNRKFTMRYLRSFGLGQSFMKNQLHIEAQDLVDNLRRASERGPVAMHSAFDVAALNALWMMFAGHRFDYEDKKLQKMLVVVHDSFRLMDTMGGVMSQMPFLRFVIPELCGYNELMRILRKLWDFIEEEIVVHERNLSVDEPRDLIEAFLLEIASDKKENGATIFDRENLMVLCLDLFLAGTKTTTDTLASIFSFLSLNPKWVNKLQEELNCVVGRSRLPTFDDISSLPLMEAFVAEAQRFITLAPLGVPHRTVKDVTFSGYNIPKDTLVLFDLHSAANDKNYWEQPGEFRPERFLDDNGKYCQNNFNMPFGLGKRRCLGEILARSSLFLFFAYILHYFDFEISPDHPKPEVNGEDGFTISPKPYYLKLTTRSDMN